MTDNITLTGLVATVPRVITTSEGLAITSFRLASSQRRFDKSTEKWMDGETNWYTITTFRQLATNAAVSVKKGERIVVTGKLRIRDWQAGEKSGTNVDVEAESLGHDLSWGTAAFSRSAGNPTQTADPQANEAAGGFPPSFPPATFPTEAELAVPDDASELTAGSQLESDDMATPF
jgi:single-strand DNA-binding protein